MHRRWSLILMMTAGALAPAVAASGQTAPTASAGLGIRLAEAPADRAGDPRAAQYIVDHVAPGTTLKRKVEVENGTGHPVRVRLYDGAAAIRNGAFTGIDDRAGASDAKAPAEDHRIADWISVKPADMQLATGEKRRAEVTIAVPKDAPGGERYGAVWAELPPATTPDGIEQVNRVGVRVYLSVGAGAEPRSDFVIDSLTALRLGDGTPVVSARVENTGDRALDMTGELRLDDGPAGLTAGPFPAELGTTLAPGDVEPVEIHLEGELPAGPWLARITMRSGRVEREATATITFPEPGATAEPVEATPEEKERAVILPIALGLLALVVLALAAVAFRARRHRVTLRAD